jgi:predicted metal-dependent peptidase
MTNKAVLDQLTYARTALVLDQPFFGMLALHLRLLEDEATPTLSVDGKVIRYNPTFVSKLSPALTKSAISHEVSHCILDHIGRRGTRTPRKWNQAGDYVINAMLNDSGFELGKTWLYNPAYANLSADEVYNRLPDNDNGNDPLDDCQDGDPSDTEIDSTDWKVAAIQAAESARALGNLPGSLQRFIDELTTPKVDWKNILRRFITETSKDDYNWLRPNKRFIAQGFFLPTLHSEAMNNITIAIDTSGSINQATLDAFGAEIKAIVQNVRPASTTVIYCDSVVNHVDTFGPNDELHFAIHGGGGTAFEPPFEYVAQNNITPACLVYLTDMYGSFPGAPEYPVLWCATTDVIAPFGETVRIKV